MGSIWDFTEAKICSFDIQKLEEIVAFDLGSSKTLKQLNIALVAPEEGTHSVCNLYAKTLIKYNSPWQVKIVADLQAAQAWLAGC